MKRVFIITAALIAALPLAHADNIVYSFTGSSSGNPLTFYGTGAGASLPVEAWGYDNGSYQAVSGTTATGKLSALGESSSGVGVQATSDMVTPESFVVLDFSDPISKGYTSASIELNHITEGWTVYGTDTAPTTSTNSQTFSGLSVLASSPIPTNGTLEPISSFTTYTYLIVIASQDCEAIINEFQLTSTSSQTTPEPGTFVLAGMALIGLGATWRKRRKR
ncbi:MAG: PEP-CTERM sorting domain-containing protein [Bryobacteraceae bacterium]|jgi:hypothetical protein